MKWLTYHFNEVESTNHTAVDYPVYSVITADNQTGGRGRYGRIWQSIPGNLYVSLVLPDFKNQNPFLAFVVGVAVARALNDFNVRLKWPNDIVSDSGKVGGILLEHVSNKIIAGIGINIGAHPVEQMNYPADDLSGRISKEQLLHRILTQMTDCLTEFSEKGFACIREQWLALSYLKVGDQMAVRLPNQTWTGKWNGIDENGLLILELDDRTKMKISAGDVFKI